jgi:hypothetical protein
MAAGIPKVFCWSIKLSRTTIPAITIKAAATQAVTRQPVEMLSRAEYRPFSAPVLENVSRNGWMPSERKIL